MHIRGFSFTQELSHSVISQICLAYLLQFNTSKPPDRDLVASSPLANYAAKYWISHTHSSGKNRSQSPVGFTLMKKFFTDESAAFLNWVRLCDVDNFGVTMLQKPMNEIAKPLYYTSLTGLSEASHTLLEMGADLNAQGGNHGNALQATVYGGHEAIAKLLIEKGADVNAQGGKYGNALYAASERGHETIAKLLIEKGADVNAQGGYYGNALYVASQRGHGAIAKLLMEKGADVNAWGGHYGNALHVASEKGHEAIAKLLIEKGADVQ